MGMDASDEESDWGSGGISRVSSWEAKCTAEGAVEGWMGLRRGLEGAPGGLVDCGGSGGIVGRGEDTLLVFVRAWESFEMVVVQVQGAAPVYMLTHVLHSVARRFRSSADSSQRLKTFKQV